jgi:hypothetical protein
MKCGYCKTLFIGCEVIGKGAHKKYIHMKCGCYKSLFIGCCDRKINSENQSVTKSTKIAGELVSVSSCPRVPNYAIGWDRGEE